MSKYETVNDIPQTHGIMYRERNFSTKVMYIM